MSPNSNHPFELLITEFPPCAHFLHVLIHFSSFGNLSFFRLVCRVPVQKLRRLERKKMFFVPYSFYINYLGLSLLLHLFILFCIFLTGPDSILLPVKLDVLCSLHLHSQACSPLYNDSVVNSEFSPDLTLLVLGGKSEGAERGG